MSEVGKPDLSFVPGMHRRGLLLPALLGTSAALAAPPPAEADIGLAQRECAAMSRGSRLYKKGDCSLSLMKPMQWLETPRSSSMRLAQYTMDQRGESEVMIFNLPLGAGVEAQLGRWEAEFPEQDRLRPPRRSGSFDARRGSAVMLEVAGRWDGGGPAGTDKSGQPQPLDYAMRGAIVPGELADEAAGEKQWAFFVKAVGPHKIIESNAAAFDAFVQSMKRSL